jgi:hypothetical protein
MEIVDGNEVVKLLRQLDALMARRARKRKNFGDLDEVIRAVRRRLRDLTAPLASDQAYGVLPGKDQP